MCRRFDTIPACDGRTDGRTDGIAVANTALAMRASRAVKSKARRFVQGAQVRHVLTRDHTVYLSLTRLSDLPNCMQSIAAFRPVLISIPLRTGS